MKKHKTLKLLLSIVATLEITLFTVNVLPIENFDMHINVTINTATY